MQLVAYGAQDLYLTGKPQITFFKTVFKQHTNFAIEAIEQTFNGTADFGKYVSCTISRNGDLISNVYLQLHMPALSASTMVTESIDNLCWCNSIGNVIIKTAEVEIGGQQIDKHYGIWMDIYDELTSTTEKKAGYSQMVGKHACELGLINNAVYERIYYIPLLFWFCRSPGMALPLIALQYHEVKIKILFRQFQECVVALQNNGRRYSTNITSFTNIPSFVDATLYVDYIYLDTQERTLFAQQEHQYLIEQLQFTGSESITFGNSNQKLRLNFNHPVKELVWVLQRDENATSYGTAYNDWFNYSAAGPGTPYPLQSVDLMADAKILLNGHERFTVRPQTYFRLVQPFQHHTRIPDKHIYVYSFALRPEEPQPSGTCNFSRIDTVYLNYDIVNWQLLQNITGSDITSTNTGQINVFAVNYNILNIQSGMAGLAYAN